MSLTSQEITEKNKSDKKDFYVGFMLLILLLSCNYFFWNIAKTNQGYTILSNFREQIDKTIPQMEEYTHDVKELADYGANLFRSSNFISRYDFDSFYKDLFKNNDESEHFEGIQGVAFIEKVTNKDDFVLRTKSDKSLNPAGYSNFSVFPERDSNNQLVVSYITPFENNQSLFGYDISSDPEQTKYMEQSRDKNKVVMTPKILLLNHEYATLYRPVFKKNASLQKKTDKEKALIGYIAVIVDTDRFFETISKDDGMKKLNYQIGNVGQTSFSSNSPNLYETEKVDASVQDSHKITLMHPLEFGDEELMIRFVSSDDIQIPWYEKTIPDALYFGGGILLIIFFYVSMRFRMKELMEF